jgi:predicted MPP superfamily phosphohydrolase
MTTEVRHQQRPVTSSRFSRRAFIAGGAVAIGATGLGLYSTEIERHFIDVVSQTFLIPDLPEAFHGFRIAQLSDIHLEHFTEDYFLRHAVAKINTLKPDLVLLTGDFISNNSSGPDDWAYAAMPHCGEILHGLDCPLRYGILGNHDVDVDAPAVLNMLVSHGITPLVNRYVPIERGGQRFWLAGLDDAYAGNPDLNLAIPSKPDAPVLLMCHEPDFMDSIMRHERSQHIDLVLSGHSHGGQVRMPFVGALQLPPLGKKYSMGYYRFGKSQLYVNRGLGTVGLPVRFDCPPEITHITLQPA